MNSLFKRKIFLFCVIYLAYNLPTHAQDFWQQTNGPKGGIIWKINVNKQGDIFVGTDGCGIHRSTNEGESWVEVNSGVTDLYIMSIAFNSAGHIYIGSNQGNIFKSIDNGASWTHIKGELNSVYSLAINDSDDIFASSWGGGVFRSTDNGQNWSEINSGLTNLNTWALAINDSGHLFV